MSEHIEKTLVLLKPDAVERGLMGKIISRFEDAGFKIVAMKLVYADKDLAEKHYDEDVAKRRGKEIRDMNVGFLTSGPVLAMVVEGINAIENVRKFCGATEPKEAIPGTIRGDYSHANHSHFNEKGVASKNIIHAAADREYAEKEIKIWFSPGEIVEYQSVHEKHTR